MMIPVHYLDARPNPWLEAGVIERIKWDGGRYEVLCWDEQIRTIYDGDALVVLRTGGGITQIIGVEAK